MARGCDLYFAECVLEKRRSGAQLTLTAMLPCPEQSHRWSKALRQRHAVLCGLCDKVEILEPAYSAGCMLRRNRAMVKRAQVLISVYDGTASGTGNTVRYARQLGLQILPVWV